MKLKYFMRGLGLGIVLVTLIYALSNTKEKLTNEEIVLRARDLGMVTKEERDQVLNQLLEDANPAKPTAAVTEAPSPVPTAQPDVLTPTPALTPAPIATEAPEPTTEPTKAPVKDASEDTASGSKEGGSVSFTIKSGMSSGQVAALLVDKGLIKDADDFNHYIEAAGKASIIRVGSYSVPQGASYDEIIRKITTKQ